MASRVAPQDSPAFRGSEAMSEAQGVEELLSLLPEQQPDPGEDSTAEAAETLVDEPEDAHQQDPLGTEAPVDDVDDLDLNEEVEDQQEPADAQPTLAVEIDGHVREMTAAQVRDRLSEMRSVMDNKQWERARAEEAATQARQEYEAKGTALDGLLADLSQLQGEGFLTAPDPALAREDPAEYVAQEASYKAKRLVWDKAQQEAQRQQQDATQQWQRANATKLLEAVPAWKDATRLNADLVAMREDGVKRGCYDEAFFNQNYTLWPHWAIENAHDARLYRRAKARQNGKGNDAVPGVKRVVTSQKTVRSQASQPAESRGKSQERDAWKRFDQSSGGRHEDEAGAEAILASITARKGQSRRA